MSNEQQTEREVLGRIAYKGYHIDHEWERCITKNLWCDAAEAVAAHVRRDLEDEITRCHKVIEYHYYNMHKQQERAEKAEAERDAANHWYKEVGIERKMLEEAVGLLRRADTDACGNHPVADQWWEDREVFLAKLDTPAPTTNGADVAPV